MALLVWRIGINQREFASLLGLDLLEQLAPEHPIGDGEFGNCVWCDHTPNLLYVTAGPDDHTPDCPWLEARKLIAVYRRYLDRDVLRMDRQ